MRLVRFGPRGREKPGLWREGKIVDLRAIFPDIPDIGESFFRNGWLQKIARVEKAGEPMQARLGSPVLRPSKIICLGKNYAEHAEEGGFESPAQPELFCKAPNALSGPYDPIRLPRSSGKIDWEVELAVIIGREAKRIAIGDAMAFIAGFCVMNDVSARQAQFSDAQWFRGKSFDTFAPLGPALVSGDEIGDFQNLKISASVNGKLMQAGTTADMLFDIPGILAFVSEDITLLPGDIVSTGTPSGVGVFRDPPVFLKAGDSVECRVEKIGSIKNTVQAGS